MSNLLALQTVYGTFSILLFFLASFLIIYFGLNSFSDGLIAPYGRRLVNLMTKVKKTRTSQFLRGFLISQIVVRKNIVMGMFFELSNAGLVRFREGSWLMLGASLSNVLMFYFLTSLKTELGLWFILPAMIAFFLSFLIHVQWPFKLLLGLSFLFFGQFLAIHFSQVSNLPPETTWIICLTVPFILSFVTASPLLAVLPFIQFIQTGHQGLWVVVLAHLGASLSYFRKRKNANVYARRFIFFQFFNELTGAILLTITYYVAVNMGLSWKHDSLNLAHSFLLIGLLPVIVMLLFEKQITAVVTAAVPDEEINEHFRLKKLGSFELGNDLIPSIGIAQILYQTVKYKDVLDRMFKHTELYLKMENVEPKTLHKIKEYERVSDNMRTEIYQYVIGIMKSPLDEEQASQLMALNRIADELESVGDYLDKIATFYTRLGRPIPSDHLREEIENYFSDVRKFYDEITSNKFIGSKSLSPSLAEDATILRNRAHRLRESGLLELEKAGEGHEYIQIVGDIIVAMRKVRSHSFNIYQSML